MNSSTDNDLIQENQAGVEATLCTVAAFPLKLATTNFGFEPKTRNMILTTIVRTLWIVALPASIRWQALIY